MIYFHPSTAFFTHLQKSLDYVTHVSHNPSIKYPGEISSRFVKIDGLEAILTAIPTTLLLKNRPFFTEYNTQTHEYLPHFTV